MTAMTIKTDCSISVVLNNPINAAMDAFKRMGFGGKYATYDVINRAPYIELTKYAGELNYCYRVLTIAELDSRAGNLEQSIYGDLLRSFPQFKGTEVFIAYRHLQNMHVKLADRTSPVHMYYDTVTKTVISRRGQVIIEIVPKINYTVDVGSAAIFEYLDTVCLFDKSVETIDDAIAYTDVGILKFKLSSNRVITTEMDVEQFNMCWEQ